MVLLRHNLLVDRDVQGVILRRTALYATAGALYFSVILVCSESLSEPKQSVGDAIMRCLDETIYWLPGFAILAPVIAYDIIRITNRFTGPVFRLRRELTRLAEGQEVQPMVFREDDYWREMSEIFNRIRDEMIELRNAKQNQAAESPSEAPQPRLFDKDEADVEILSTE
jgi:hypothetical protein